MPIDTSGKHFEGLAFTRLHGWEHNGHEVALMRVENTQSEPPVSDTHLMCECDFQTEDVTDDDGKVIGHTHTNDPHECASKEAIRELVKAQCQASCQAVLAEKGLKEAILAVYDRVKAGEYLGQAYPSMIYAQEVAKLLDAEPAKLMGALEELFAEEKLDLNGMILTDYVRRFRFPREVQWLFRMMVEAPLGWPNGDAGEIFLHEIEGAINEHTDYKHGKDAFHEHNFPHVDPMHLIEFGHAFLGMTLLQADEDERVRHALEHIDKEALADSLEAMAASLRQMDATVDVGKGPLPAGELFAIMTGSTQEFEWQMQKAQELSHAAMRRYCDWLTALLERAEKDGTDAPEMIPLVKAMRDSIAAMLRFDDDPSPDGAPPGPPDDDPPEDPKDPPPKGG